jgi:hypothetical protein
MADEWPAAPQPFDLASKIVCFSRVLRRLGIRRPLQSVFTPIARFAFAVLHHKDRMQRDRKRHERHALDRRVAKDGQWRVEMPRHQHSPFRAIACLAGIVDATLLFGLVMLGLGLNVAGFFG